MKLKSLKKVDTCPVENSIQSNPRRLCHPRNLPVDVSAFAKMMMLSKFNTGGFASDLEEDDEPMLCGVGAAASRDAREPSLEMREEAVDDMAFMYDGVASLSENEDDDGGVPAPAAPAAPAAPDAPAALEAPAALAAPAAPAAPAALPTLPALVAPAAAKSSKKRVSQVESDDGDADDDGGGGALYGGMAGVNPEAIVAAAAVEEARAAMGGE